MSDCLSSLNRNQGTSLKHCTEFFISAWGTICAVLQRVLSTVNDVWYNNAGNIISKWWTPFTALENF